MRSNIIFVVPPARQHRTGTAKCYKNVLVQQPDTQPPVERREETVQQWLARCDIVPGDGVVVLPLQDRTVGKTGSQSRPLLWLPSAFACLVCRAPPLGILSMSTSMQPTPYQSQYSAKE